MKIDYKKSLLIIGFALFLIIATSVSGFSNVTKNENEKKYSEIDANMSGYVSILFAGDIMLGRNTENDAFEYVDLLTNSTDISFGNLEYAITNSNIRDDITKLSLKSSCSATREISEAGFDIVSLANNHIMDFGERGLNDTIDCIKSLNLSYVGAGKNSYDAKEMKIITVKGLKIGFLAYTARLYPSLNNSAKSNRSGVAYTSKNINHEIMNAKKKVDFLIVSTHWGKEYGLSPSEFQMDENMEIIDNGADLVIGTHPHVIQPIERYKDKYIFYSLGNFVFDQRRNNTRDSNVFRVFINNESKIVNIEKIDVRIEYTRPFIINKSNIEGNSLY